MSQEMTPRQCCWSLAVAAALVLAGQTGGALLSADTNIPHERPSLTIVLAASKGLSTLSARALTTEAAAIWRRSGIELHWLPSEPVEPFLKVVVTSEPIAKHGANDSAWRLGQLRRLDDRAALAVVSLTEARRIVDDDHRTLFVDQREQHDYRVGVVLGRVVAHEVGHFLLATDTHAASGLMRAAIDVRELGDLQRLFQLDAAAQEHLARLAATPLSRAPLFSYAALR